MLVTTSRNVEAVLRILSLWQDFLFYRHFDKIKQIGLYVNFILDNLTVYLYICILVSPKVITLPTQTGHFLNDQNTLQNVI